MVEYRTAVASGDASDSPPLESASISTYIGMTWSHHNIATSSLLLFGNCPRIYLIFEAQSKHLPFLILLIPLKAYERVGLKFVNIFVSSFRIEQGLHRSQGLHWGLPATTSTECQQSKGLALTGGYGSESVRPLE